MLAALYLYLNAALYALFAVWCAVRLESTARNLGYETLSNSGRSEYLTVYGGLQWGLALIFLLFAHDPALHRTGVVASLLLYAPLVLHRAVGLLRYAPVSKTTKAVAALEVALLAAAVALFIASAE